MATPEALPVSELRKVCDPESLDFDRSSELAELVGGLGQERAEEALRFALSMRQPGYHVFVLGEAGTGRHATVARMLSGLRPLKRCHRTFAMSIILANPSIPGC